MAKYILFICNSNILFFLLLYPSFLSSLINSKHGGKFERLSLAAQVLKVVLQTLDVFPDNLLHGDVVLLHVEDRARSCHAHHTVQQHSATTSLLRLTIFTLLIIFFFRLLFTFYFFLCRLQRFIFDDALLFISRVNLDCFHRICFRFLDLSYWFRSRLDLWLSLYGLNLKCLLWLLLLNDWLWRRSLYYDWSELWCWSRFGLRGFWKRCIIAKSWPKHLARFLR